MPCRKRLQAVSRFKPAWERNSAYRSSASAPVRASRPPWRGDGRAGGPGRSPPTRSRRRRPCCAIRRFLWWRWPRCWASPAPPSIPIYPKPGRGRGKPLKRDQPNVGSPRGQAWREIGCNRDGEGRQSRQCQNRRRASIGEFGDHQNSLVGTTARLTFRLLSQLYLRAMEAAAPS